jgi:hypothetical protein
MGGIDENLRSIVLDRGCLACPRIILRESGGLSSTRLRPPTDLAGTAVPIAGRLASVSSVSAACWAEHREARPQIARGAVERGVARLDAARLRVSSDGFSSDGGTRTLTRGGSVDCATAPSSGVAGLMGAPSLTLEASPGPKTGSSGGVEAGLLSLGWGSEMASFGNSSRRALTRSNSSTAQRYRRSAWAL